jgi:hypothetical protein
MVRVDDAGDVTKCWLSPDELSTLERSAGKGGSACHRIHLALLLIRLPFQPEAGLADRAPSARGFELVTANSFVTSH